MKTLKISDETHKALKVFCAEYGLNIGKVVDALVKLEFESGRLTETIYPQLEREKAKSKCPEN